MKLLPSAPLLLLGLLSSACELAPPGNDDVQHIVSEQAVLHNQESEDLELFLGNDQADGSSISFPETGFNKAGDEVTHPARIEAIHTMPEAASAVLPGQAEFYEPDSLVIAGPGPSVVPQCLEMNNAPSRRRGAVSTSCFGYNNSRAERGAKGFAEQSLASSGICESRAPGVPAVCAADNYDAMSEVGTNMYYSLPAPSDQDICGYVDSPTSYQFTRGNNTCGVWPVKWRTYKTTAFVRVECGANCT